LEERQWKPRDVRSKLLKKKNVEFAVRFHNDEGEAAGRWEGHYNPSENRCTWERIDMLDFVLEAATGEVRITKVKDRTTADKPDEFTSLWKEIAVPILDLRNAGLSGVMREAIDNAIKLMAKCRHREMSDLTLYSIIATETILNPFNALGDTSERFAIFAASLTAATPDKRLEAYRAARYLYRLRSQAVHQSRLHADKDVAEAKKEAFKQFLACLKAVTAWAARTLDQGRPCGPDEFKEFYASTIFSPAAPSP
jgi:hypothetical protein